MNFEKEIKILLSSSNFIIYILTEEEERLEYSLNMISKKIFQQNICTWNFIEGYTNNPNHKMRANKNPLEALNSIQSSEYNNYKMFLLKDFDFFINDLSIIIKLKNISEWIKINQKYIFLSSSKINIPEVLQEHITFIKFPLPNELEIKFELEKLIKILNINTELSINELTLAYKGFSINRIRKSLSKIPATQNFSKNLINHILNEKKILIEQANNIDFYYSNNNLSDIAGLINLKKWLRVRKNAFSKKAYNYGISLPKGILLVGIQGTGKSLSAKAIAKEWNLPLLKLDVSRIFGGILGESENNIQNIINICEQISPCILWIDEIDKIFTHNINTNDSGTTNRVNNIFLTWLSEKNSPVFIVATANNLNNLSTEIIRKGRFDEIFFVDLPNFEERINIFKIHLEKVRPLSWYKYNIYYLSQISNNFSGAEIEQSIIEAMYSGFYKKREFNTKDIIISINNIIPLAFTNSKNISRLKDWIKSGKIRSA
uniref:Uncharacterized AAA domain-containing protein ycf46 n=1 Tax=Thuretia quercifolia TaxID=189650 RepID=A0A1Z1MK51_9FLOR|nr:hypothetical protein [Thuretia quercifolia]ARW66316.1 hypothetical protein [Thuretia quercifolia]